jgi:energy-coupling factor transport system ATP-binding protein
VLSTRTVIRLNDYSYAYPEADDHVLRNVDLEIRSGECHCLSGPTGSGKTTLALALKGLLPLGKQSGEITFPSHSESKRVRIGLVLQNPEVQVLRSSLGAEAAFGLENLCMNPDLMPGIVSETLSVLGLEKPLSCKTGILSMGQKYRLIVASHLVMNPHLLVLDEPAGQLDPDGLRRLLDVIRKLKQEGISILLCENRPEYLHEAIDFFWQLDKDGMVRPVPIPSPASQHEDACPPLSQFTPSPAAEELINVRDLSAPSDTGSPVWSSVNFSISRGQRVLIEGLNGSGKTTLLRCLIGFIKPSQGEVRIFAEKPVPWKLQGKVGCLFQNPQRQIFETSVLDEVAFPLKRLGNNGKDLACKVRETLSLCSIENLAEMSPHKLSYGQKRLVALACTLVHNPELLILDDPFAGLDKALSRSILELLCSFNEKRGTTIICTSHDPGAMDHWAHLSLGAEGGRVAVH